MKIDRRTVLAGMLAATHSALATGSASAIESFIAARMAAKEIPGAGIAIARRGKTLLCAGYGWADIELAVRTSDSRVFPMASASKLLAGITAMLLAEADLLDLDAPVARYIPELDDSHGKVLVKHLLSLTSGLNGPGTDPTFGAEAQRREANQQYADARKLEYFTPAELITAAARLPARSLPGTVWRYDQFPFFLFGQIVARVTSKSYDAFVEETIFTRLGMKTAEFGDSRSLVTNRRSTNYSRESGVLQNLALRYTPSFWPAAGCNASAADLLKLWSGLRAGQLLKSASLERMFAPTILNSGETVDYGLGCTIGRSHGRSRIGHEGGGCCYLGWWPAEELGVAVLFNLSGSQEDGIESRIAELILN